MALYKVQKVIKSVYYDWSTKAGHHDIAEILLKVALNTKNQSIMQDIDV
jgi:hypothetical protein